ncbi:L37A1 protein, partial [Centropus bengalensis]|nr:L37A1 protein [Centropus bengalensis]
IPSYSGVVEHRKKSHGLEGVKDAEGVEGAPAPRQDHVWTYRRPKQGDSPYLSKSYQLFHEALGNGNPEEEPIPPQSKAAQRLNTKEDFFSNLLVNNIPSAASSVLEDMAEEGDSSLGEHLPAAPHTTEKHQKQQEEGSSLLNKQGSSNSLVNALLQVLFEIRANHHLRLLVPDKALRTFIARVVRVLRMECSRPKLWPACTKLVSKTGLLMKVLSRRRNNQGAFTDQCLQEGDISNGTAQANDAGGTHGGKWNLGYISGNRLLILFLILVITTINLVVVCLLKICFPKSASTSKPRSTRKSRWTCFLHNVLPRRWRRKKCSVKEQDCYLPDPSQPKPLWLQHLYQPLDSQHEASIAELYDETSEEEEIFNRSNLM